MRLVVFLALLVAGCASTPPPSPPRRRSSIAVSLSRLRKATPAAAASAASPPALPDFELGVAVEAAPVGSSPASLAAIPFCLGLRRVTRPTADDVREVCRGLVPAAPGRPKRRACGVAAERPKRALVRGEVRVDCGGIGASSKGSGAAGATPCPLGFACAATPQTASGGFLTPQRRRRSGRYVP